MLHGGDYNADQWWANYPEVINEDFQLMPLAGCNAFSIGIFAWASLEPQEGVYDFRWLDDIMDRLASQGLKPCSPPQARVNPIGWRKNTPRCDGCCPMVPASHSKNAPITAPARLFSGKNSTISAPLWPSVTPTIRPWVFGTSTMKSAVKPRTAIANYAMQISENG